MWVIKLAGAGKIAEEANTWVGFQLSRLQIKEH